MVKLVKDGKIRGIRLQEVRFRIPKSEVRKIIEGRSY